MIRSLRGIVPDVDRAAYIDPSAQVIADVVLGEGTSVWMGAVVRGDAGRIAVGARTVIEDNCVLHCDGDGLTIGDDVVIGHNVVVHCSKVGDRVLLGNGSVILDGAQIGDGCIIGAGALVAPGKVIPPRSKVFGVPGHIVGTVSDEEVARTLQMGAWYQNLSAEYRAEQSTD